MYDVLARQHNGFFELRGYWDEALQFGHVALDAARSLGDENMLTRFTCIVAGLHMKKGDYATATNLLQPLVDTGGKAINKESYLNALHFMGMIEFQQHNYERAEKFFQQELTASEEVDGGEINLRGIANCTQELGRIARLQGRFDDARGFYERSLAARRQLKNIDGSDDIGAAKSSLHDLGLLSHQQGEWEQYHNVNQLKAQQLYSSALSFYAESLRLKYKFKNYSSMAHTLTEAADLARLQAGYATSEQQKTRLYKKARARLATSLKIKERLYDQLHVAFSKYILGRVNLDEGELSEAQKLCDEALEIRIKFDDRAGIAGCRYLAGLIAEKEGACDHAALLFREALEIWKERRLIAAEYARVALSRVSSSNL
jgi:tetratricopeptide (TPR) repeat protein